MNLPDAPIAREGWASTKGWREKGALSHWAAGQPWLERRCYMSDPDGYLIAVGRYTQFALDHFKKYAE